MNRQMHTMPCSTYTAYFDKPLNVKLDLPPEISFHLILVGDDITDFTYICISEILYSDTGIDSSSS